MANLKEIRTRISSVKSTQQITSAMKMVAASKLRKAQSRILTLRPYARMQLELLQTLTEAAGAGNEKVFAEVRPEEHILIVVFSSNRGLSGAYNSNVLRQTNQLLSQYKEQVSRGNVEIITVGKKATEFYTRKTNLPVVGSFDHFYDTLSYDEVAATVKNIINDFVTKKYDKILLVYHQFKNAVVQYLKVEQFLPVMGTPPTDQKLNTEVEYIFDPSREEIMQNLIPQVLKTQFYKALSDAWASEQGARMTAMSQATDNATELLKDLRMAYNKARQASITKEILEIVSGAEALKNV
ncbi:MAG TPA: ATP synthase F1 subunit gamma [Bacteroidales bacterium]|jgi:F-type H+-transporting ATPase subunit gamma|nr:ATP synthase F1 subunit gamma [Bacteroidales bacterium]